MKEAAFYQQQYETEWQLRDHLQTALSTPLSILVLVGTALVLLAQKFSAHNPLVQTVFWASFAIAATCFLATVYLVVRSFHGYVYQRIPFPSQLLGYHEALKRHHEAHGTPGLADEEFDLYLRWRYVEAGDRNAAHNANRVNYLHQANRALITCLCALVACTVPYVISLRHSRGEPPEALASNGGVRP
jgi:hypothetical protein